LHSLPPAPLPRETLSVTGEAFSSDAVVVVPVDAQAVNTTDIGTVYTFGQWASNVQNISSFDVPLQVDGETATFWIELDGYCTRVGLGDGPHGYCHFTYTAMDPMTSTMLGSFVAQGYVIGTISVSTLAVTGGVGIFNGVSGLVELEPSVVDNAIQPPFVESAPINTDSLDDVDGYLHILELRLLAQFALG